MSTISTRQNIGASRLLVFLRTRMFRHWYFRRNVEIKWFIAGMNRALEMPYGKIRQVACGPCTISEYKGRYLAGSHVIGCRRKRRACPYQGVRHGINGQHGGLRKALFRRKGGQARNYGFAFIGVDEGPYHSVDGDERRLVYWGLRRGYWNICFLPYVRGKLSVKAIDCLIVRKIREWLYCPFEPPFFALK